MDRRTARHIILNMPHHLRVMYCIIMSQLIMISVFKFWPEKSQEKTLQNIVYSEVIAIEEVEITRQTDSPPPPPKPQIPIPVPNDQIIEEYIELPEELDLLTINESPIGFDRGDDGDKGAVVKNPQLPPNVIKIREPELPREARAANLKAEIVVTFLVSKTGNVLDAFISEIRLYDKKGANYEIVDDIGYGLLEATIEAALMWKFRPAKDSGENVKTYTEGVFSYGL